MNLRVVAALAVAGVLAYWGWQQFVSPQPVPADEVTTQLAQEEWGSGFCYDHETQWPCVIPTDISLDKSDADYEARDRGTPYRRCFDIRLQIETTHWDYSYGGPSDPRTYMAATEPARACANVTYFTGNPDSAGAWSFTPTDDPPWFSETVQALHSLLCASPPADAAYNCLS